MSTHSAVTRFFREEAAMSVHRVAGALVVLLALVSSASAELVSNSGLMVYYSFDDAANLAYDSSGNEFHGTVVNDEAAPTLAYADDSLRGGVAHFTNAGKEATAAARILCRV
ncbi:MAG: hypothetical protein GX573_19605 [Chloroflexi bacterium]|nr:hypothetical protein [Chloroflexota bacterium]